MRAVRIETSPFQILSLVEFESILKKNQHGCAKISGYISAEEKNRIMAMISEETWAHIWFYDETGGKNILFCGYIEDLRIHAEADTFLLTVLLKTGTGKMDMGEHIGVYQNASTSYQKILETIVQGYTDGKLLMGTEAGNIGKMVVQYKETDWEFAKRLAAQKNTVIMANEKSAGVKYTFGIVEEAGRELLSYEAYSIVNLIGEYQIKKDCGMAEKDAVAYKVKTREIFYLGDSVCFFGKNYIVGEAERKWEGNEVYNYYLLETKGELRQMSYGNKKIIGASMKGNVTAVKKDTVKVVLMEDKTGGWAGQKWFAYSTIYSSPDGTGWYCMPEKGDSVRLYFPNENEAEAYVNSSVNEQSSNSSARSNPDEKSIKNKQGKEVLFQPDRLILTNNNGMSVKIIDDEGIIIESDKSITIRAKENIGIISMEQGVEMSAPEKIAFQQGSTMLELADDINVQEFMDGYIINYLYLLAQFLEQIMPQILCKIRPAFREVMDDGMHVIFGEYMGKGMIIVGETEE